MRKQFVTQCIKFWWWYLSCLNGKSFLHAFSYYYVHLYRTLCVTNLILQVTFNKLFGVWLSWNFASICNSYDAILITSEFFFDTIFLTIGELSQNKFRLSKYRSIPNYIEEILLLLLNVGGILRWSTHGYCLCNLFPSVSQADLKRVANKSFIAKFPDFFW